MTLSFQVPGPPIPQGSTRAYNGHVVHSNAATLQPWRDRVAWAARAAINLQPHPWDPTGPMSLDLEFHLPRPKAHRNSKGELRATAPYWHTNRADIDKLTRAVNDALTTAGVWGDDSQLAQLYAIKRYGDGPGLLICNVWPL